MAGLERITPQNNEAEQSFLGSLLLDKDAMIKVADTTTPDDFYVDKHRRIYEAMLDLYRRNEPIDLLSLGNRLGEKGELELVGGRAELIGLSNAVPTASHVEHYGQIVQRKATLRRLLKSASEITALGYQEADDVADVLDKAERSLFNVSQKFMKHAFTPIRTVLADAFDRIDELHREQGKLRGVPTNYTELDNLLGGMQKSDLIIIAARPACGKTSFALDIARIAAVKHKVPVGIFSLEMSKEQLVDRMICAEANVDDSGNANIMEVRTKARRLQTEHGLGMLIVDYLQLMEGRSGGGGDNRTQEVAEITRGLKSIARELNIPVIALSQLSRSVELQKPAIPRLAHLRESGSIEQDADIVMFIYRKAADKNYRPEDLSPEEQHIAEIHVAKHRNGPTGIVKLFFDAARASFRNLQRHDLGPPPQMKGAAISPGGPLPPAGTPPPMMNSGQPF